MLHLMIGNGKGKTSSAAGAALRAAGHGKKVVFAQFLKDGSSGEISVLQTIPGVTVVIPPVNYGFTFQMNEQQRAETAAAYNDMLERIAGEEAFLIVLDEALHALNAGLIEREKLEKVLEKDCEIIITGYDPPEYLTERADYISDVKKIKHPYDKGVSAREAIEF